ncbi:RHS repeat-associated core domain-containing protein [Aestuariibacter sp. AA17]|uniref:RHS repeat-associated core domain-containing protein n=1 Tax=Fluctibacter corallii TaxID=2984329 RepID=A0ABT3ACZ9_9ALTE|nr:RHS repeat-associated core domain-containing protein [Aestuariibacter sp. AA17]MCV2886509.1 RHS repeat-associated core domain-containing protein [Aestuariibacter sp. AA17]
MTCALAKPNFKSLTAFVLSLIVNVIVGVVSMPHAYASDLTTNFVYKHESLTRHHYASMKEIAEDVDPSSGQLSLAVTDISIPGNNALKVELRRKLEPTYGYLPGDSTGEFGAASHTNGSGEYLMAIRQNVSAWTLDLPYIRAKFANTRSTSYKHIIGKQALRRDQLCSRTDFEEIAWHVNGSAQRNYMHPFQYWDGLLLHIPGKTTEQLLTRSTEGSQQTPSGYLSTAGETPSRFTKSNYAVTRCLTIDDPYRPGETIEGFEVAGPDGMLYQFGAVKDFIDDFMVPESSPAMKWRRMLMITRIEDRFGNYVEYNYNDNAELISIESSDARRIDIQWEGTPHSEDPLSLRRIASATANGRKWSYSYYNSGQLHLVTLPDDKFWEYPQISSVAGTDRLPESSLKSGTCSVPSEIGGGVYKVTDPDGLVTEYTIRDTYHGTYNTPTSVLAEVGNPIYDPFNRLKGVGEGDLITLGGDGATPDSVAPNLSESIPDDAQPTLTTPLNLIINGDAPELDEQLLQSTENWNNLLQNGDSAETQSSLQADLDGRVRFDNVFCKIHSSVVKKAIYADPEAVSTSTPTYTWHYQYSQNTGYYGKIDYGVDDIGGNANEPRSYIAKANNAESAKLPITNDINTPDRVRNDPARFKTTTVISPANKKVYYVDRSSLSRTLNKPLVIDTFSLTGQLLQREEFKYDGVYIADGKFRGLRTEIINEDITILNDKSYLKNAAQLEERVNLTSKTTTVFSEDGNAPNTYTVNYTQYNMYGGLEKTEEFNDFSGNRKYTRNTYATYLNGQANWVNLPTKTELSKDDVQYIEVSATEYDPYFYYAPKRVSRYGNWVSQVSAYHQDPIPASTSNSSATHVFGLPKTIEFNAPVQFASGQDNQYRKITYDKYKRGVALRTRFYDRYTDAAEVTASKEVDDNGWVISETTLGGVSVKYQHDQMGRMLTVNLPKDTTNDRDWLDFHYAWEGLGEANELVISRCNLNNDGKNCDEGSTRYSETVTYDFLMRPVLTIRQDLGSNLTRYQEKTFDEQNREIFTSFITSSKALNKLGTSKTFDGLGRLKEVSTTDGGTITHEYLSQNRIKVTDARDQVTVTAYQAYGTPAYDAFTQMDSPEGVRTAQIFDIVGNVTQISQTDTQPDSSAKGVETLTEYRVYDSNNQLCAVQRADVGTTRFTHSVLGQLQAVSYGESAGSTSECGAHSADKVIRYQYDNFGDIHTITYPDMTENVTHTYDLHGNLTQLVNGSIEWTYAYNNLDMLVRESLSVDDKRFDLDYGYSLLGHKSSITYPDGDNVTYAPNAFGEPTQAVRYRQNEASFTYAADVKYHPNGYIHTFEYGGTGQKITHKTQLNSRQLPETIKDFSDNRTALEYTYTYDYNNNITKRESGVPELFTLTGLQYDGLDRLTHVTSSSGMGDSQIRYDGLGNITYYQSAGRDLVYEYDANTNRLMRVNDSGEDQKNYTQLAYDSRGNVTNTPNNRLMYNAANQLFQADTHSSSNFYFYDGHNRRVKVQDSEGTHYSVYSQDGVLLYQDTPAGGVNNIYLGSKLIAKDGFIPNPGGTQNHRPYGSSIEGEADDIGYTGHKFDTDLGLSYMQARYYDPVIGRFYSNDPVGFDNVHNFNRYSYANNNPYKYIDPDGRDSFLVSRALKGLPIGNHNFIVSHAKYLGDPNAKVYSWGPLDNGKMGFVNHVNSGGAAQTWEDDVTAWQSLSSDGAEGVAFRAINASDGDVSFLAGTVQENRDYRYVPSLDTGSVNSNSAAGAVAHAADGGPTDVPTGGWQPGHQQSSIVNVGNSPAVHRVSGRIESKKISKELD